MPKNLWDVTTTLIVHNSYTMTRRSQWSWLMPIRMKLNNTYWKIRPVLTSLLTTDRIILATSSVRLHDISRTSATVVLYVAEDLHCSYWQEFEGGIYHPYSSIAFFKRIADIINHEHWGLDKTRCELMNSFNCKYDTALDEETLAHIHSIEFINSMCVIRKAPLNDNTLGSRFILGTNALVCSDILPFHGSGSLVTSQNENQWSARGSPVEEELLIRIQEVADLTQIVCERDREITSLKQIVTERELENLAQLALTRLQLEAKQLEQAVRENTYSHQLQEIHQSHELQIAKLEQSIDANLHATGVV